MGFAGILRQSTAVDVLIGPFVDSADGDAEETGLTIAQANVLLHKNGQAGAQKNDNTTCAHDADGYYNCELDATDTNTVGQLTLQVHVAGALAVRHDFQVVEEAVYDALYAASATGPALPASITALDGKIDTIDNFLDTEIALILEDTGTTLPALIAALENLSAAEVNAEVVDALATDTYAEPGQGTPAATLSLAGKIGYLYKAWRNKTEQTETEYALYNDDGTTKGQKATFADDDTTATRGEITTGA